MTKVEAEAVEYKNLELMLNVAVKNNVKYFTYRRMLLSVEHVKKLLNDKRNQTV